MQIHQTKPVCDELEELYSIAVKEHGADSRSGRLIRHALEQERREPVQAADAQRRLTTRVKGGERPR